jgi:Xaa-Pro aminopeptidase
VDSGGQYLTGTTDITRTVPMGECSYQEKEDYTLVLKGMIDLATAVFPRGTTGHQLDALARMPLWKAGRNFGHGTGHGIGYYLCVHEGPQSIRWQANPQPLLPGMVTSNEPGLYREGMHGVRHENIILCRDAGSTEFGDWLDFETLTCCHIDTSAVLPELLGPDALAWLNGYNDYVYKTLAPLLPDEVAQWLKIKTSRVD